MTPPVKNPKITSPYGPRKLRGKKQFHDGIDFVSETGDNKVYSIGEGVVCLDFDYYENARRWIDKKHSAGNYIIIRTKIEGKEYYVRYLHIVINYVEIHQFIEEGAIIGEYGDVGYSFGAHLHLDMYNPNWRKIDPTPVLDGII
jgi:murein DD-endopeptidase MepM/ murein hydrolase activator NlpD